MNSVLVMAIAAATCAATMLGGLFALSLTKRTALVLGFSAGAVLGVAAFDLMPEALTLGAARFGWAGVAGAGFGGFLLYDLFERLVARQEGGAPNPRHGFLAAGSFSLHSLLDGLGIGLAFQASHHAGLVVAAAVLAHDFADGLNTVNVVVKNGATRRAALRWLWADALAPVAGAAASLFFHLPPAALALLLAGFAGFFFYIGALELLPESQRGGSRLLSGTATLAGAAFLFVVARLA